MQIIDGKNDPFKGRCLLLLRAYVLRISRYWSFLLGVLTNTGIFLRGLKPCGEIRNKQVPSISKKKIGDNHAFFGENKASIEKKKRRTLLCILLPFRIIVAYLFQKNAWLPSILYLDFNIPC